MLRLWGFSLKLFLKAPYPDVLKLYRFEQEICLVNFVE